MYTIRRYITYSAGKEPLRALRILQTWAYRIFPVPLLAITDYLKFGTTGGSAVKELRLAFLPLIRDVSTSGVKSNTSVLIARLSFLLLISEYPTSTLGPS
jgi:hypothetical protein